jgi:hypothetical protein
MALIEDAIPERTFLVICHKSGPPGDKIRGTEALAKHLKVPQSQIPIIRLWKYTVGEFTVYEQNRNPSR